MPRSNQKNNPVLMRFKALSFFLVFCNGYTSKDTIKNPANYRVTSTIMQKESCN